MDNKNINQLEKIRQQFDGRPYPRHSLDRVPKTDYDLLFIHSSVTPYYLRNKKVIDTRGKFILDAGCGTGYKALALAEANPGAKIVGIDLSEESVKMARQRLKHHGLEERAEFHSLSIEDLPSLGMEFDYINADEVLYLLPDLATGLQALKSVLKPDGILRGNLHSSLQRIYYYRAQAIFKMMGLMDENPRELELELSREIMRSLKDEVSLKKRTWSKDSEDEGWILSNYLLQGDRGYTIKEMFAALEAAKLEFIGMVKWRQWELMELFEDPENLPGFLAMSLPEVSVEDKLHLFELLHPIHRLLDFWCGHSGAAQPFASVGDWTEADWQGTRVHLHPILGLPQIKENLLDSIKKRELFQISKYVSIPTLRHVSIDSTTAACLLPLWEGTQSITSLVERWLHIRPVDPVTLEPVRESAAFEEVTELLEGLESFLYVLLEPGDRG